MFIHIDKAKKTSKCKRKAKWQENEHEKSEKIKKVD